MVAYRKNSVRCGAGPPALERAGVDHATHGSALIQLRIDVC